MKKSGTIHFDNEGFSGDVYVADEQNKGFNALRVSVRGEHPLKKIVDTTRVYLVISGSGTFTIDNKSQDVQVDDLYVIESGSEYKYEGEMELFEFNIFR